MKKKIAARIGFASPSGASVKPNWRDQLAAGSRAFRGQTEFSTFESNSRAARRKLARMLKKKSRP